MDQKTIRVKMVEEQLVPRGIKDRLVLKAFMDVPRHEFVPEAYLDKAYADYPLPIGEDQTISQPYMVALQTECLGLKGQEKILEVGSGSGYQTAILAEIAGYVYSIERIARLAAMAEEKLKALGYVNFSIRTADGSLGWPENAPYDGIVVTAGSPEIPKSLVDQLKDGGRLVIPVGGEFGQILTIVEKNAGVLKKTEVCACTFVPLIGEEGWRE